MKGAVVGQLGNTPRSQTVLLLEQRKSYALGLRFIDRSANDDPLDITGVTIRCVVSLPQRYGGTVAVTKTATILDGPLGLAQVSFQALDLDLETGEHPFTITFVPASGYSTTVIKGVIDIQPSVDPSTAGTYADINPSTNLAAYIEEGDVVEVTVDKVDGLYVVVSQMILDFDDQLDEYLAAIQVFRDAAAASATAAAGSANSAADSAEEALTYFQDIQAYDSSAAASASAAAVSASQASTSATTAAAHKDAANTSKLAAATSASGASTSATSANTAAAAASASQAAAATSATAADASADAAAASVAGIEAKVVEANLHADNASASAAAADTSADAAAASQTAAATSASAANTSKNQAATSATSASSSAGAAAASASSAASAETAAETALAGAQQAETNAETAETNAETAQAAAAASQSAAATSATNAATSATTATTKASEAATSASQAATSATAAAGSATAADTSAQEAYDNSNGFEIGTTTLLGPGETPTADIVGVPPNRLLNLGIPTGANPIAIQSTEPDPTVQELWLDTEELVRPAQRHFQDSWTSASAGEVTVTLGADPLDHSILVFRNGLLVNPDEYDITARAITFNVAQAAGDEFTVYYAYDSDATAEPAVADLAAYLVVDNFNRANGGLGTAESGQTWTQPAGMSWSVSSNRAVRTIAPITPNSAIGPYIFSGEYNCSVEATYVTVDKDDNSGFEGSMGVAIRVSDENNGYFCDSNSLLKRQSGSSQSVLEFGSQTEDGDTVKLVAFGNDIRCYRKRAGAGAFTYLGTYTNSFNNTATGVGFKYTGPRGTGVFDNFLAKVVTS